jgi:hypothetical protein
MVGGVRQREQLGGNGQLGEQLGGYLPLGADHRPRRRSGGTRVFSDDMDDHRHRDRSLVGGAAGVCALAL